jgi:hypothetical protein
MKKKTPDHLLFFFGEGCPHCDDMDILCSKLEKEGHVITRKQVWGNEANTRLYDNYRQEKKCNGLPLFVNTKTGVVLCGAVNLLTLKRWAEGANVIQ